MWFWIILLVTISIYNTIYSFLPENLKNNFWVKLLGISTALALLVYGIYNIIVNYKNYKFAYVSKEGRIIKHKNFIWTITKGTQDDNSVFIINERYGDASDIKIVPDEPRRVNIYNAMDGVGVRFFCTEDQLVNFKIVIEK